MNIRIKKIRNILNLSQKDFAEKLGLKQNAISYMEKKGTTVTEQNIKLICSQFNVNENWLRTGNGEIFIENKIKQNEFFEIFDKLSTHLQDYLIKTAKDLLETQNKMQDSIESNIDKSNNPATNDNDFDIDKEVESYRHELELERKATDELSASREERKHA